MKRSLPRAWLRANSALAFAALLPVGGGLQSAGVEPPAEAKITVLVRDVKLLPGDESPRPAELNETVSDDTAVRTGNESRSELTFLDLTITRLGSNTIYSFNKAGRSVELNSGSILIRVPKNSGGAQIKTAACSVAITGTTLILEATRGGRNRMLVLEGGVHMSLNKFPNETAFARRGQLLNVPPGARKMPKPVSININSVMKTHPLIKNFPPLPNEDEIYAGGDSKGGGTGAQNPAVYNPPPLRPSGSGGPIGNPGGNNPGPHYPEKGKTPGGNAPNGPVSPEKSPGGKGEHHPVGPNNPGNVNNPPKNKGPGHGKLPRGPKGDGQPVVNKPKPTATPKPGQILKQVPNP